MADFDQTQVFSDNTDDETDDESDNTSNSEVGHLKVFSYKDFPEMLLPLHKGVNLIGRDSNCKLCIPTKALSKEHACIEIHGNNFNVYDKKSRNKSRRGTLTLVPEVRYEIRHEDMLLFADVKCQFFKSDESKENVIQENLSPIQYDYEEDTDDSDASSDILKPSESSILDSSRPYSYIFSKSSDILACDAETPTGECSKKLALETPFTTKSVRFADSESPSFSKDERQRLAEMCTQVTSVQESDTDDELLSDETQKILDYDHHNAGEKATITSKSEDDDITDDESSADGAAAAAEKSQVNLIQDLFVGNTLDDELTSTNDPVNDVEEGLETRPNIGTESEECSNTVRHSSLSDNTIVCESADTQVLTNTEIVICSDTVPVHNILADATTDKNSSVPNNSIIFSSENEKNTMTCSKASHLPAQNTLVDNFVFEDATQILASPSNRPNELSGMSRKCPTHLNNSDDFNDSQTLCVSNIVSLNRPTKNVSFECEPFTQCLDNLRENNEKPTIQISNDEPTLVVSKIIQPKVLSFQSPPELSVCTQVYERSSSPISSEDLTQPIENIQNSSKSPKSEPNLSLSSGDNGYEEAASSKFKMKTSDCSSSLKTVECLNGDSTKANFCSPEALTQIYDLSRDGISLPSENICSKLLLTSPKSVHCSNSGFGSNSNHTTLCSPEESTQIYDSNQDRLLNSSEKPFCSKQLSPLTNTSPGSSRDKSVKSDSPCSPIIKPLQSVKVTTDETNQLPSMSFNISHRSALNEDDICTQAYECQDENLNNSLMEVQEDDLLVSPTTKHLKNNLENKLDYSINKQDQDTSDKQEPDVCSVDRIESSLVSPDDSIHSSELPNISSKLKDIQSTHTPDLLSPEIPICSKNTVNLTKSKNAFSLKSIPKKSSNNDKNCSMNSVVAKPCKRASKKSLGTNSMDASQVPVETNPNLLRRSSRKSVNQKASILHTDENTAPNTPSNDSNIINSVNDLLISKKKLKSDNKERSQSPIGNSTLSKITCKSESKSMQSKKSNLIVNETISNTTLDSVKKPSKKKVKKNAASFDSKIEFSIQEEAEITSSSTSASQTNSLSSTQSEETSNTPKLRRSEGPHKGSVRKSSRQAARKSKELNSASKPNNNSYGDDSYSNQSAKNLDLQNKPLKKRPLRNSKLLKDEQTFNEDTCILSKLNDKIVSSPECNIPKNISRSKSLPKSRRKANSNVRSDLPSSENHDPQLHLNNSYITNTNNFDNSKVLVEPESSTFKLNSRHLSRGSSSTSTLSINDCDKTLVLNDSEPLNTVKIHDSPLQQKCHQGRKRKSLASEQPSLKKSKISNIAEQQSTKPVNKMNCCVMFTGVVDDNGSKMVAALGGKLVESINDCSVLITDKVRRTVKFLCGVSLGIPIVSLKWLKKCQQENKFVDPTDYLIKDNEAEKQYNFVLSNSLKSAQASKVLAGMKIYTTPSVKPPPNQMKDIILSAGGEVLKSKPSSSDVNIIAISCKEDSRIHKYLKCSVVNVEFILTGILRQNCDPKLYKLN